MDHFEVILALLCADVRVLVLWIFNFQLSPVSSHPSHSVVKSTKVAQNLFVTPKFKYCAYSSRKYTVALSELYFIL